MQELHLFETSGRLYSVGDSVQFMHYYLSTSNYYDEERQAVNVRLPMVMNLKV